MSHRNMAWTQQAANFDSEGGHVQVQPGSFNNGGPVSNFSNQGVQVGAGDPGNNTNIGISDLRSYYGSTNNQQQHIQNLYPYVGVDPSSVHPTMYNPSMSTSAANIYVPHTQSFGLGNPLPSPLYHQAVMGTMGDSSSSGSFNNGNRDFIKRKSAVDGSVHHSVHGFASSSSSALVPQNPSHGPWSTSFESYVSPNATSADGPNTPNLMAANPEFVCQGSYVFPAGHMSQCNIWISQAANGIADGVPHRDYSYPLGNPPGQFFHSGTVGIPNGSIQDYQAGPSAMYHWPSPHFSQIPVHSMQTPGLYNHILQMQGPVGQSNIVHGVNPSGTRFTLDPRIIALSSNSGHTLGPLAHQFLANQVNNGSSRMLPYENTALMDLSRLYEASHAIDEQVDMGLDIDSMTYEELVALEEQIGYVNTGLSESYILENLRSSFYVPGATCMPDQSSVENDACTICQEEYEARELVGTLECGHKYHSSCIKQWLMVKNLCPICKTTALSADRRKG